MGSSPMWVIGFVFLLFHAISCMIALWLQLRVAHQAKKSLLNEPVTQRTKEAIDPRLLGLVVLDYLNIYGSKYMGFKRVLSH